MVLLIVSAILYFFGMILFFVRPLLLLSNVNIDCFQMFFLAGLYFFIGFKGLFKFFVKKGIKWDIKGKVKGSIVYFGGFILIILNFTLFGTIAQIFGILLIFRTFLPDLYDYTCRIPLAGKYLSTKD